MTTRDSLREIYLKDKNTKKLIRAARREKDLGARFSCFGMTYCRARISDYPDPHYARFIWGVDISDATGPEVCYYRVDCNPLNDACRELLRPRGATATAGADNSTGAVTSIAPVAFWQTPSAEVMSRQQSVMDQFIESVRRMPAWMGQPAPPDPGAFFREVEIDSDIRQQDPPIRDRAQERMLEIQTQEFQRAWRRLR